MTSTHSTMDRQLHKRESVKCYLYDGRAKKSKWNLTPSKEEIASINESIGERNRNIPIVYLTEDDSTNSTDTLFGEVPIGSPLSYQLRDHHCSKLEFSAYIPSKVDIVLQDNLRFPDIPIPQPNLNIDISHLDETSKKFLQSLNLTKSKAEEIEEITIDQSLVTLWHDLSENRLTAEKFGDVINIKSQPSEALIQKIFTSNSSRGMDKKDTVRKLYIKKMKSNCQHDVSVFKTGLSINPNCPYLGASPDGKILDRSSYDHFGLLQIKCPYKYRNFAPLEAAKNADFCLEIRNNGELHLKKSHKYFYQVIGQMAITGINWCDFVVFTNKGLFVERICFDKYVWATIFPSLAQFFVNIAVPYLTNRPEEI